MQLASVLLIYQKFFEALNNELDFVSTSTEFSFKSCQFLLTYKAP